jgi:hypothetical protein
VVLEAKLNNPNIVGHNDFLEPTRILIMRITACHINSQPMLDFYVKVKVGHIKCIPIKLMWMYI